ncbi:ATP-grasp fold amidoligase family protein [Clostridium perfringens]|uniref:ATP-grasp fold amidoligase family protein n=1 Tax=Clostridium perfringens TaxID=1502 RepID=UPI002A6733D3|nr:ATP-grasp fold amidoligase family protein [Clostridium perfringens]
MRNFFMDICKIIPDKLYLKIMFFYHFHKILNFNNVQTLNEKIQWLKINDRVYNGSNLVDKYEVRKYIKNILGEKYLIPLIGVWNSMDEINFDELPDKFVLKCTHDSKSVIICKDKSNFKFNEAKEILNKNLKKNAFWYGREWPYRNVTPRIICEKYMVDESGSELKDYKIMCFNGVADNIMVCYNRKNGHADFKYFDLEWNELFYNKNNINRDSQRIIEKPKNLDKMIEIAEKLSTGFYFTRIDLYDVHGEIYFGEITFYPASGFDKDITEETDYILGKKLNLKTKVNKNL